MLTAACRGSLPDLGALVTCPYLLSLSNEEKEKLFDAFCTHLRFDSSRIRTALDGSKVMALVDYSITGIALLGQEFLRSKVILQAKFLHAWIGLVKWFDLFRTVGVPIDGLLRTLHELFQIFSNWDDLAKRALSNEAVYRLFTSIWISEAEVAATAILTFIINAQEADLTSMISVMVDMLGSPSGVVDLALLRLDRAARDTDDVIASAAMFSPLAGSADLYTALIEKQAIRHLCNVAGELLSNTTKTFRPIAVVNHLVLATLKLVHTSGSSDAVKQALRHGCLGVLAAYGPHLHGFLDDQQYVESFFSKTLKDAMNLRSSVGVAFDADVNVRKRDRSENEEKAMNHFQRHWTAFRSMVLERIVIKKLHECSFGGKDTRCSNVRMSLFYGIRPLS